MGLTNQLIVNSILASSLILTSCGNSDKRWGEYIEHQSTCTTTVKAEEGYWKIAERTKRGTEFEKYFTGFISQKLENYRNNPQNKDLRQGMEVKIPCGFEEQ